MLISPQPDLPYLSCLLYIALYDILPYHIFTAAWPGRITLTVCIFTAVRPGRITLTVCIFTAVRPGRITLTVWRRFLL